MLWTQTRKLPIAECPFFVLLDSIIIMQDFVLILLKYRTLIKMPRSIAICITFYWRFSLRFFFIVFVKHKFSWTQHKVLSIAFFYTMTCILDINIIYLKESYMVENKVFIQYLYSCGAQYDRKWRKTNIKHAVRDQKLFM